MIFRLIAAISESPAPLVTAACGWLLLAAAVAWAACRPTRRRPRHAPTDREAS